MEDVHTLVIASYLFGKSCMTSFLDWMVICIPFQYIAAFIVFCYGYAWGAEDNGDTILSRAVAIVSVLRAFLHGICNLCFQQVEVLVLCLEQHCS